MQKELLEEFLLNGDLEKFKAGIQSLYKKYLSFHDVKNYAFMPAFFDGWLMTSGKPLGFTLYKSYQTGVLGHDISSYVLIKGSKAYIITLNNVALRDGKAQSELVRGLKRPREKFGYDENVFFPYEQFLEDHLSGETKEQRAAQAAFILSQDESFKEKIKNFPTDVTHIGISAHKEQWTIEIGPDVATMVKEGVAIPDFIKTTKEKLQITSESSRVELFDSDFTGLDELVFDEKFERNIEKIAENHSKACGKESFREINLHGIMAGCFFANRRALDIVIKSNPEAGKGRLDLAVYSKRNPAGRGYIFEFKVGEHADDLSLTALNQINTKEYAFFFEKNAIFSRVEKIGMALGRSPWKVKLRKQIYSFPIRDEKLPFSQLLANGAFPAFKAQLKLFSTMVISYHDLSARTPEFLPAFILGFLVEGTLKKNIDFYVIEQTYENYSFLIVGNKNIILLSNTKNETTLDKYNKKIKELAREKNINQLDVLTITLEGKEIFVSASSKSIAGLNEVESMKNLISFKKEELIQGPFFDVLEKLMTDQAKEHRDELSTLIKSLLLKKQKEIFPNPKSGEAYIHGVMLGVVAESWHKVGTLMSNPEAGYGRSDVTVIPKQERKRKINDENHENKRLRPLIFEFKNEAPTTKKNLPAIAQDAIKQIDDQFYKSVLSEHLVPHLPTYTAVGIAAYGTEVAVEATPRKIDYSSDDFTPSKEPSPHKRPRCRRDELGCTSSKDEENSYLNEISNLSESDRAQLENIEAALYDFLREQGIDASLVNALKEKISEVYDSSGVLVLDKYLQTAGYSSESALDYKRKNSPKLKGWFSIVTLYDIMDSSISLRQGHDVSTLFAANDILQSSSELLGKSLGRFRATKPLAPGLKNLAANPILQSVGFLATIYQLGHSVPLIISGKAEADTYYWTARSLHHLAALGFRMAARTNLLLLPLDMLISFASGLSDSFDTIDNYARVLPLSDQERSGIGANRFFGLDLSFYDQQKGLKEALDERYRLLKNMLLKKDFRAVVYFGGSVIEHKIYVARYMPQASKALVPCGTFLNETTYLVSDVNPRSTATSLPASTEGFLPTHEGYLGSSNDTKACLNYYYYRLTPFRKKRALIDTSIEPEPNCKLIDGSLPTGSAWQKYFQLEEDRKDRSIEIINGADSALPTKSVKDSRFGWVSVPLGTLPVSQEACDTLVPLKDLLHCLHGQIVQICDKQFSLEGDPFILADKDKPEDGPIAYLNAPVQTIANKTITKLEAIAANPAYMTISGEEVAFKGSPEKYNYFFLPGNKIPQGYIMGGNAKDTLIAESASGDFSLKFTQALPTTVSEGTLTAVNIENYMGSANATETIEISSCSLRFIDAKGSPTAVGDIFNVNPNLRCNETDPEQRMVYAGDQHQLAAFKPGIYQLTNTEKNVTNPTYLIQSHTPCMYPQIILIDEFFDNLNVSRLKTDDSVLVGKAYQVATKQGRVLLKSNATENIIYQTKSNVKFYLRPRTLNEVIEATELNKLYKELGIQDPKLLAKITGTSDLEDLNMFVVYEHMKEEWLLPVKYPLLRYLFTEDKNTILESGSIYKDTFSTHKEKTIYEFHGGEGADFYEILPSESDLKNPQWVIINNNASLYDLFEGQDILDLSAFEYLDPKIHLEEMNIDYDRELHYARFANSYQGFSDDRNTTLVLAIEYDNLATNQRNKLLILLKDYLSHEDYQHIFVLLSRDPGSDILYKIDVDNKQLLPIRFYQPTQASLSNNVSFVETTFTAISLAPDAPKTDLAPKASRSKRETTGYFPGGIKEACMMGLAASFAVFGFVLYRSARSVSYSAVPLQSTLETVAVTTTLLNTINSVADAQPVQPEKTKEETKSDTPISVRENKNKKSRRVGFFKPASTFVQETNVRLAVPYAANPPKLETQEQAIPDARSTFSMTYPALDYVGTFELVKTFFSFFAPDRVSLMNKASQVQSSFLSDEEAEKLDWIEERINDGKRISMQ